MRSQNAYFVRHFDTIARVVMESAAKRLKMALRYNIDRQRPEWAPHSARSIARKLSHGSNYPSDVWRDMGILYEHIDHRFTAQGPEEFAVEVGIWTPHDRVMAALCLEYGSETNHIQARPLFRPVAQEMQPILDKEAEALLHRIVKDAPEVPG